MPECNFCERPKEWIISSSENFYITPSKGQIVEGYLLINSKKHFIGYSAMAADMFDELEILKQKVRSVLSREYTAPIFFEHGPINEFKRGGCCVEHAHIHCVPINCDIVEDISRNFKRRRIEDFAEMRQQQERHMPYFFRA